MKKLIVNADDFGLTRSVTDGIIKGAQYGIIRSASFIVNTDAFEYSVEQAKTFPTMDIGIHIAWVGEDGPVAENVKSLLKGKNFYINWRHVIINRLFKRLKLSDAEREARAQIEKLLKRGIHPSHIDSHQHLHLFPGFSEIIIRLAKEYSIPFVRCPDLSRNGVIYTSYLTKRLANLIKCEGLHEPPRLLGSESTGRFPLKVLANIVETMPSGVAELMIHPGLEDEVLHHKYR